MRDVVLHQRTIPNVSVGRTQSKLLETEAATTICSKRARLTDGTPKAGPCRRRSPRRTPQPNTGCIWYPLPRSMAAFTPVREKLKKPKKFLKRVWDKESKRIVNAKDDDGRVQYMTVTEEKIDDVWDISYIMPASRERLGYPTQKPIAVLNRIIAASSNPGDMILDPLLWVCDSPSGR